MNITKKRVMIIGPRPPATGGISTYISNLEKHLKSEGVKIIPITPYVFHMTNISTKDLMDLRFLKNIFVKIYIFITNMLRILRHSRKESFLAHIHTGDQISFVENSLYMFLLKTLKIPIILHIHATTFHLDYKKGNPLIKIAIKYAFTKCDIAIVLSNTWKKICENMIGIPHDKLKIIHNAVDIRTFRPLSKVQCKYSLQLPHNKKIIFSLGSLIERKGFNYLIDAMEIVAEKRKDVLCFIGGSGPLEGVLQKQITELNLQNHIKLVGFVSDELLPLWMNACDIFVFPSLNEGVPLVMFESLACGKPFVGTKVGGIPEIISSEDYGLLVEPANPEDLAEKILIAIGNEWDSEKIRKYAERFVWDVVADKVIKCYETLLEANQ